MARKRTVPDNGAPVDSHPLVMRWPPWMDARYHLAASEFRATAVVVAPDGSAPNVPGDARRWAIGFIAPTVVAGPPRASPYPPQDGTFGFPVAASEVRWFTVFEFGAMVGAEWYLIGAGGETYTVVEILLQ